MVAYGKTLAAVGITAGTATLLAPCSGVTIDPLSINDEKRRPGNFDIQLCRGTIFPTTSIS